MQFGTAMGSILQRKRKCARSHLGNPGSVIVPQYSSSKITVFVWGKNTIVEFIGNTK